MRYLTYGLAFVLMYSLVGWGLASRPFALSVFGNATLVLTAALVPVTVWRRRGDWAGCQRLFFDLLAISIVLWIVGHLGWAYDQLRYQEETWLKWHTLFSLCAGFGPLVALLARPHRGPRPEVVAPIAMTMVAYCLLAVFIYSYFVLVPSVIPAALPAAQQRLLVFVQTNRLLLLVSLTWLVVIVRGTPWRPMYMRLAVGAALGFVLRLATNQAITRGEYQVGTIYDFAWIVPWLFYAWAAAAAPASPEADGEVDRPHEVTPVSLLALPALLIPLVGYGVLNLEAIGEPVDSFRLLLTSLTTVAVLGLVTVRLAMQGSELQRTDKRLQLLAAATEHTGDLILIARSDGAFEHANGAFLRAFGYTRAELAGRRFVDLIEPGMDRIERQITAEVNSNGVWRGTLRGLRKDGTSFPAACTITALRDAAGRVTHFVGIERDMTDDLKLRDQLVHTERLSAIGELIAGVAHEINNPLQTIIGCTELMLDDAQASNRADLELVRKEAMRAGQIVRNLLAFARRGASDRVVVDLNALVRATADLRMYHLQQINIELTLHCALRPLPVLVNREEIRQVILNLLLNAEHAIVSTGAGSGSIVVETLDADGLHSVEVSDSGPGISPELRGRIFEPFFTTREVGEGTGLGLSISLGIVSSHGGTLTLVDSPRGARFRLSLPSPAAGAALEPDAAGLAPRALVVDDDAAIRKLIVKLLERRGFDTCEAETGDAAIVMAMERQPSVVVCDAAVPGMSSVELYRELSARDAERATRFVFISSEKSPPLDESALAGVPILVKPFTASDLQAALAEAGVTAPRAG